MLFSVTKLFEIINCITPCILETSKDTVRKSVDETKTFVKWEGETAPSSVDALTTKEGPYSYEQILNILTGSAWTPDEPI